MTLKQLKQELVNKPSYFKESAYTISQRFKCPVSLVKTALGELRDESREYNRKKTEAKETILKELREESKSISKLNRIKEFAKEFGTDEKTLFSLISKNILDTEDKILPKPFIGGDYKNVLVVGDLHAPFIKPGYLEFCRDQQEKFNCQTVVMIGDIMDAHAVSFHDHDPDGRSAGDEYKLALEQLQDWYKVFPKAKVCIGNHDARGFRQAFKSGLPSTWLKSYKEILESPKDWEWDFQHIIDDVIYTHGTGLSGELGALNAARENRQSTVIGHLHTVCNTRFLASYKDLIFGMTVGCGIEHDSYAFAYGKENARKPVVACGVILQGKTPINIPMHI